MVKTKPNLRPENLKKLSLYITCLLLSCTASTQSLQQANNYFENFQYDEAFNSFMALKKLRELTPEDQMKMVYSGYVVGEFEKTHEPSKEIILKENVTPFFYYIHGEICMHLGDYDAAKAAYIKYSELEDEMDVSVKIQSCNQIALWEEVDFIENKELAGNTKMADHTGADSRFGNVRIHEQNIEYFSSESETIKIEGLVLSKPYLEKPDGAIQEIKLPEVLKHASIQSFVFLPNINEVIFTVSEPLSEDAVKQAPHLYSGKWESISQTVSNIKPWLYSGFEDTSFCAQATVDASGERIVFAKNKVGEASDLYITNRSQDGWSKPQALDAVNTKFDEMFPMFQGDSLLTFSTNGRPGYGDLDLFSYDFKSGGITHFKAPINSSKDDFNFRYTNKLSAIYTSNRSSGSGDDDRYGITFPAPPPVVDTKPDSTDFYHFVNNWKDQTIYFDFDRYDLENDVKVLDELIAFLGKYSQSEIHLDAHTDRRGEDRYNYNLSEKRATTVVEDLVRLGISEDQIIVYAKGESNPVLKCDKCTERMHQENRVVIVRLRAQ